MTALHRDPLGAVLVGCVIFALLLAAILYSTWRVWNRDCLEPEDNLPEVTLLPRSKRYWNRHTMEYDADPRTNAHFMEQRKP